MSDIRGVIMFFLGVMAFGSGVLSLVILFETLSGMGAGGLAYAGSGGLVFIFGGFCVICLLGMLLARKI